MSRPITIVPFALTANYPAGASLWSGLPTKVSNTSRYLTPDVMATAEEINAELYTLGASLSALTDYAGQAAAQNWRSSVTFAPPGVVGRDRIVYDTFAKRWLACCGYGTSGTGIDNLLYESVDGGVTWTGVGGTGAPAGSGASGSGTIYSAAVRPSDGLVVVITDGRLGTLSSPYANFGTFSEGKVFWYSRASKWLIFGRDASFNQVFMTSADGSSSSSPTFPAGKFNLSSTNRYFAAASSSMAVVCSSKLGAQTVVTSSDATASTWTAQTVSGLGGTEFVVGLEYAGGVFVMGLSNSGNSRFLTSPDGVTWTEIATHSTLNFRCFTSQGAGLLAGVAQLNGGSNRIVTSRDNGLTWQFGAVGYSVTSSSIAIAGNGSQFIVSNSSGLAQPSHVCGAGT